MANLTGTSPSSALAPPPAPTAGMGLQDAANRMSTDLEKVEAGEEATQKQIRDEVGNLKPPKVEPIPQPVPQATDAKHIWGSSAMLAAALGSLLTRTPLTTALNAAAGVITAFKKGDQEQADAQFKTWKAASDNYMKLAEFQQKTYEEILGQAKDLSKMSADEANRTERNIIAEYTAQTHAFQDETARIVAEQRGVEGMLAHQDRMASLLERQRENAPKMEQEYAAISALRAVQATPEFKALTPLAQAKTIMGIIKDKAPDLDTRGDGSEEDRKGALAAYNADHLKQGGLGGTRGGTPETFEEWYVNHWPNWGTEKGLAEEGGRPGAGKSPNNIAPPAAGVTPDQAKAYLKKYIGADVAVTSTGRSAEHNAAVGGAANSEHLEGEAIDFVPHGMSTAQAAQKLIDAGVPYDQIEVTKDHVHLGFAPQMRGEVIGPLAAQVHGRSAPPPSVRDASAGKAPPHDVAILKQNPSPQMKALFDKHYGQGAADRALAG